jgi:uncharacterized membrane protein
VRRFALPAVLLLALLLRLVNLGGRPLWYDEAFAILFAREGLGSMLYGTLTPVAGGAADIHPLLYYVTLDGWMTVFGESAAVVRLWSVLLGVATVGVMYLLGRDLFSRQTGLAAALVTALAPFHVQYSQEARMYSLMALLLILVTWCALHGTHDPAPVLIGGGRKWAARWGWWLVFGILAGLAMYTQQLSAFYLAALGAILLLRRKRIDGLAFGVGLALLVYLPWLVQLPGQLSKVSAYYWVEQPTAIRFLLTLRTFFSAALDFPPDQALILLVCALFLMVFFAVQVIFAFRRRRHVDHASLALVLWLFIAPVVLMWLVSQWRAVYLERSLLPSALMLYLVLGWLFTRGGLPRPIVGVLSAFGLVLVVVSLLTHYSWSQFPNSPFEPAAAAIRADLSVGDVVVHHSKLSALPMRVYDPALPQHYLLDAPGSSEDTLALPTQEAIRFLGDACISAAANGAERVWFVVFPRALAQAESMGREDMLAPYRWLQQHYTLTSQQTFNDLDVLLFTRSADLISITDCA